MRLVLSVEWVPVSENWMRSLVGVLGAFIALSSIGGGIAMLVGVDKFPVAWLRDTPFSDYTIPALVLAIVVGGSSGIATVTVFTRREVGVLASLAAGLIMASFIVVEAAWNVGPRTWLGVESLYLGLGLVLFGLAAYLWIAWHRGVSL